MAADKEIFELPEATVALLLGSGKVSFVAQVQGYNYDFQVKSDTLAQYLGVGKPLAYGGNSNPDPALGVNRDFYFQNNGKVWQKNFTMWSLVATIVSGSATPYTFTLDTTKPDVYTLDNNQLNNVNALGAKYPPFTAIVNGRPFDDIWPTYTGNPGAFTAVTINLHPDGSGNNAESTIIQFG